MNDWRVQLAAEVNDRLRSKDNKNFTFILCQPYQTDEADRVEGILELSELMHVQDETKPKLFYMSTPDNKLLEFDYELDLKSMFSADLVLQWLQFTQEYLYYTEEMKVLD